LQIKIGDKTTILAISDNMLVGRQVEDDATVYGIDLSPFGGYQSGVSRKHAVITREEGGLYIEDLGSTNGTRINGFQLTVKRKYRLRDGDEIEFARLRTQFKFIDGESDEAAESDEAGESAQAAEPVTPDETDKPDQSADAAESKPDSV
jgi:pSer/pThr/pTyr-binding forkhead associated (FHA) protein